MNVLAVGAHFDDIERGCSGTLAKHMKAGDTVIVYVATKMGIVDPEGEMWKVLTNQEEDNRMMAQLLGCRLECDDFEVQKLEFTSELTTRISHIIKKYKIDVLYTHSPGDVHHDHAALSKASLHAGRHVPKILTYCCNTYPVADAYPPTFFVDITETWEMKEKILSMNIERVSEKKCEERIAYYKNEAINYGLQEGCEMAEGFHCIRWLQR